MFVCIQLSVRARKICMHSLVYTHQMNATFGKFAVFRIIELSKLTYNFKRKNKCCIFKFTMKSSTYSNCVLKPIFVMCHLNFPLKSKNVHVVG